MPLLRLSTLTLTLLLLADLGFCSRSKGDLQKQQKQNGRKERFLNLFNIVTFRNEECVSSTDSTMTGTCLTSTQCTNEGGSRNGNCASGFGVCCVFMVTCGSSSSVSKNCTYITNSGFPSSTAAGTTCTYNVAAASSDICFVRLDFSNFAISGPTTDVNSLGNCLNDYLQASSPISATVNGASPPRVCGTLTGQHMYVETGSTGTQAATLSLVHGAAGSGGTHKIKVTQIECSNRNRPPSGCVQYFTGSSGTIKSYNFDGGAILAAQAYSNCIRQEEGFCSFNLRESTGITAPDPFQLHTAPTTELTATTRTCDALTAHVFVPNEHDDATLDTASIATGPHRCGIAFSGTTAGASAAQKNTLPGVLTSLEATPFIVGFHSPDNKAYGTGFTLDYHQVPC